MIDLNKFCNKEFASTSKPFSRGHWTYATNGYICIRVSRRKKTPNNPDAPDVEQVFTDAKARGPYKWVDIPEIKIKQHQCKDCRGTGKWIDVELKRDVRKVDIKKYTCEEYEGRGLIDLITPVPLEVDGVIIYFSDVSLKLFKKELPKPKIGLIKAIADQINSCSIPAVIKFVGGSGLVMPMRP